MKNIPFFLLICFIFAFGNAFAYPYTALMTEGSTNTFWAGGVFYQVEDLSDENGDTDWNDYYNGYKSENPISYSGWYLGTITNKKNDSFDDFENLVNRYTNGEFILGEYSKAEEDNNWKNGDLVVSGGNDTSGAWFIDDASYSLNFYVTKAKNSFAIYFLDPAQNKGYWSTRHLPPNTNDELRGLSHLSASIVSTPVPEPASMILLGACFVTLAGFRLRKKK